MASLSSIPSAPAPAPAPAAIAKISSAVSAARRPKVSFRVHHLQSNYSKPTFPLCKVHQRQRVSVKRCLKVRARLDEVVGSYSNDGATSESKSEISVAKGKEAEFVEKSLQLVPMSEEAISEFLTQVASLVKLVDSRDVVELKLKKLDCELIIRKMDALPQPPASAPIAMTHQPPHPSYIPQYMQSPPAPTPIGVSSSPSLPSVPKPTKSLHPPLKSPMAGTFYRSSGPGIQPFVKVGDQVKKGQVLCIVEAMKLMNEIEADQAGKVTEILAEDGKPVGIEQPLFIIEP